MSEGRVVGMRGHACHPDDSSRFLWLHSGLMNVIKGDNREINGDKGQMFRLV